jgi:hypothetical protein
MYRQFNQPEEFQKASRFPRWLSLVEALYQWEEQTSNQQKAK